MMNPLDMMVTCPYEPSHRVTKSRMPFHLTRCSKRHPTAAKINCPYDTTHLIDPINFDHHKSVCPSRGIWETYAHVEPDSTPSVEVIAKTPAEVGIISDEDWSGGNKVYCPEEACAKKNIVRSIIGASKKERRDFRMAERSRIAKLEKNEAPKVIPKVVHDNTALRLPKNIAKALLVDKKTTKDDSEKENADIDNLVSDFGNISTKDDCSSVT